TQPRSVLCTAMVHQGRLVGVVYLENNVATNVFGPARLEMTQFVAAQAAVAVENASLYSVVQAATAELRRANETLEAQVAERTAELSRTLANLWSEMDLARKIQTVLLPRDMRLSSYEIAGKMVAADEVGGDYYDIVTTKEG